MPLIPATFYYKKNIPIDENDDFGSLYNKLKILGSETLIEALYKIETHQVKIHHRSMHWQVMHQN